MNRSWTFKLCAFEYTLSSSSILMHSDLNQSINFKVAALKLHEIFPFMQICKETLHVSHFLFISLQTSEICVQQRYFYNRSIISIPCTLSCSELCIPFHCCVAYMISQQPPNGSKSNALRPRQDVNILCFLNSQHQPQQEQQEEGSPSISKKLESLKLNTTKLLSD